ncbi:MAG TPA: sugar phosphate nucleotidyltransferase [Smithellaceae bacterium]|nr:sugar phosphate nucleotidyltransferase [Smithellaceae bacterium]
MQVVILCGGTGTRLKEQTEFTPKPLIRIGGRPIIWHIMQHYSRHGFDDFVLALGYKQEAFKDYFCHYFENNYDIHLTAGCPQRVIKAADSTAYNQWEITLSDTGENTLKGGRIKRIEKYMDGNTFMLTYGDAVSDINLTDLLKFHNKHRKMVTVTGVHPEPRFGELLHKDGAVISYREKPDNENLVNGGFMVCEPAIFKYLDIECDFEHGALEQIARMGELMVYPHDGFWKCMDTLNDMIELQRIWDSGKARWKTWR